MAENKDLHFIRILLNAFGSKDKKEAMKAAFKEIKEKGKLPEYQTASKNFEKFLKIVDDYVTSQPDIRNNLETELSESTLIALVTDTFPGTDEEKQKVLALIKKDSVLLSEYERIRNELSAFLPKPDQVQIEIEKNGKPLGVFEFDAATSKILVREVEPGDYVVKLSSGLLLWQGNLLREKLVWTYAYPGEKLPAAAETEPLKCKPSYREDLAEGEIRLEIVPGLESGAILLTLKKRK